MSILLNKFIKEMQKLISKHALGNEMVSVFARPLTPEEAIGSPAHDDYPLLKGKERIMQAVFQNVKGHAYSDHTGNFSGSLSQVFNLPMDSNFHRALLIATANAALRKMGLIKKSCHCKDDDPVTCATYLKDTLLTFSPKRIGMIGHQPRLLEEVFRNFEVRICDRDPEKIDTIKSGVKVEDSGAYKEIVKWADLILATGTTLVNDTIDNFTGYVPIIFYGITISGAAKLLNLNHFCPLGR
ncbi:MAG: hypothetical protein DRG66_01500 [Deltaproteobacteria bacterium]|nr:MAG: hypothetical protein DRG66_01500 [Deltaproteobacteria bacterium]